MKPLEFTIIKLSPHERWGRIEAMGQAARVAEDVGLSGIYLPDHVVMPTQPGAPQTSALWYDNFVLAAYLATVTRRIRLIFYVLVVPYRPPIQTAKQLATLDVLSSGRITCGVGVGWLHDEFQALGVPFGERGAIMDEYLQAMKALWTQELPSFQGTHVQFHNVCFLPKGVQKPHIPLWIGGSGPRALRRVVDHGAGWVPMTGDLAELARGVAWIKGRLRSAGRNPEAMDFAYSLAVGQPDRYTPHPSAATDLSHRSAMEASRPAPYEPEAVIEGIGRLREVGFNHIYVRFSWENPAELMRHMEWFAAKVMPAFRR